jgi:hypothetical protein
MWHPAFEFDRNLGIAHHQRYTVKKIEVTTHTGLVSEADDRAVRHKTKMESSAAHLKFAMGVLLVFAAVFTKQEQIIGLLIFGGPFLAALFLPIRHTHYAIGLAIGALIIELPACLFFSFAVGVFSTSSDVSPIRVLTAILCYVAIACWIAYRDQKVPEARATMLGVAALSFMFVAVSASVVSTTTSKNTSIRYPANVLGHINACAHQFSEQHGGQFPTKLTELGAKGTGCLETDFAKNHGVRIKYKATSLDGKPRYSVLIKQGGWFNFNSESYYSDDSGLVHESTPQQAADQTTQVLPTVAGTIQAVARCLTENEAKNKYPRSFDDFPVEASLVKEPNRTCSKEFVRGGIKYQTNGTKLTYERKAAQDGFLLDARPEIYGQQGIRSYVVDETGIAHATPKNRRARLDDPIAPQCEYDYSPCIQ